MSLTDQQSKPAPMPIAYPIEDMPGVTGVPRTKIFEDAKKGLLVVRKHGRTSIVEHDEAAPVAMPLAPKERARAVAMSVVSVASELRTDHEALSFLRDMLNKAMNVIAQELAHAGR